MGKRTLVAGLAGLLLAVNTGCGLLGTVFLDPYARPLCDPGHCPPDCGYCPGPRAMGPAYGRVLCDETVCEPAVCGVAAGCGPVCDPCGPYVGRPYYGGLLGAIYRLFTPVKWCGPSCGEAYWGGYLSDPPDCCDPCDGCGNWTGMQTRGCVAPALGGGAPCGPGGCMAGGGYPRGAGAYAQGSASYQGPVAAGQAAGAYARGGSVAVPPAAQPSLFSRYADGPMSGYWPERAANPNDPYAPKLISVTDRAVSEIQADEPVQRTAEAPQPTRAVRQ